MLTGAPAGSLGLANPTGWMTASLFVDVIKHFIKHTLASSDNPALLILDNHESHLSIEALDLAKKSGITVLTLHPRTTAKLQPLDVGLNDPFKVYYNAAIESWLLRNPGRPMTIYNVAECVGSAYQKAMTPTNFIQAFKKTGIFPFDADIFTEIDFLQSTITDRPDVSNLSVQPEVPPLNADAGTPDFLKEPDEMSLPSVDADSPSILKEFEVLVPFAVANRTCAVKESDVSLSRTNPSRIEVLQKPEECLPNVIVHRLDVPTDLNAQPGCSNTDKRFLSPKEFMPSLKAGPQNNKRRPRRLGKSMIATDTPEKDQIIQ